MKISYQWLNQLVSLTEDPETIGKILTGTGLEVESIEKIESIPGGLEGVVIGEVLTCEKHPEADKLSLTTVDAGQAAPLNIVCGAPNVQAGQKVIVALVGATLHPASGEPFTIKKAKIRGAASEGMICAEDEIGLGTSHAGIMVLDTDLPNGTPAVTYFGLEADYQIEIGLTPNRADAASHLGVARDLKAVLQRPVQWPSVDAFQVDNQNLSISVSVENSEGAPRYTGLTIDGLTVAESPDWLKQRLRAIGLNPINNVVDVTNYVCHELGQPLHAFDADQIAGGQVIVKTVAEGTPFVTLDGVERKLSANDLMICNAQEPMCIAGVFGGQKSGVTAQTTRIFLESAYFDAAWIRRTSQYHSLKTDASFRFERGTDPNMPVFALKRAALLLKEIAGGTVSSDLIDLYPNPVSDRRVPIRYRNVDRLIGISIDRPEITRILESLDIRVADTTDDGFTALVPPYRVDVEREADVIEEILRIYGLDNVPLSDYLSADYLSETPETNPDQLQGRVSQLLAANGFYETMTNSLTRPAYHDAVRATLPNADVPLLNPLSEDLSVMRQTLLFSGLETLVYNVNRRQKDLKIFEFGKVYSRSDERFYERPRLGIWMTGRTQSESWLTGGQRSADAAVSYHDLAAVVQRMLTLFRIKSTDSQPADPGIFQYGLTLLVNKKPLVSLGLVKAGLTKLVDLKQPVFYADFDWQYLLKLYNGKVEFEEVSRFPEVRRDLSLVLDTGVTYAQISRLAYLTERKLLRDLNVFDVYEGENLEKGKKSYSVSFILQDPAQTLNDTVIDKTMNRLMSAFERELGAVIRK
ncbi:phenylalanyl-tRNA synthetase beta subunit [Larkinella arboricola]|uniref:Phenylalanine--tRNA ligase beta subunit n=1 Tax=Larkinella arboricola TaxID=643671 RepID=A0A327X8L2_LARAB|nr:phenylalanine--tRNA ligase subunit beta [Larkinella arboricola]RAK03029.1 phenylalanyl-tRNA synthetase beta subunit [Larkinella arboricola]